MRPLASIRGRAGTRRTFVRAGVAALAGAAVRAARAQPAFPSKTVTFVVPSAAGGALDLVVRRISPKLAELWSVPVVVENKPGAMGSIGITSVMRSAPDGHTALIINAPIVQLPWLMKTPYDPFKDVAPVAQLIASFGLLAVPKATPVDTIEDFVAMVKAAPGRYSYGSWGPGTSTHLQGALLCKQAGLDMTHVPFNGSAPMVTNLVGGHVSAAFVDIGTAKRYLDSLKLLAVNGTARSAQFPNLPTMREKGFHSFEPLGWAGIMVPGATPPAVIAKFSEDLNRVMRMPDTVAGIEGLGLTVVPSTSAELAQVMRRDSEIWGKIIRDAGITLDK